MSTRFVYFVIDRYIQFNALNYLVLRAYPDDSYNMAVIQKFNR